MTFIAIKTEDAQLRENSHFIVGCLVSAAKGSTNILLIKIEPGNIDNIMKNYKFAVAGTGHVGLSIAMLLSQHHKVTAVDIVPEKVEIINDRKSPLQDDYIEKYLAEKDLDLTATLDAMAAYSDADFVVIATPTNYVSKTQHLDTSTVEAVIKLVM